MSQPLVSIVLATHNRADVLAHTLSQLADCGLSAAQREIFVVDNASTDATRQTAARFPDVTLVPLRRNRGACAKAYALPRVRGEITLFLDDDSYPHPDCLPRMLEHFRRRPDLAAASCLVHLPDGSQECSALPDVFIGCGVGIRTAALREVGGLDASLFMAAEEYDVSCRLLAAGWRIETLPDLHVEHLKSPTARQSERVARYDIRNNLRLIARYFPTPVARIYNQEWRQRYQWLARLNGHEEAYSAGRQAGALLARLDRLRYRQWRLHGEPLERLLRWQQVEHEMQRLRAMGVRRIILADLGKNIYAFWRGARAAGLRMLAVADDRFCQATGQYRDLPVVSTDEALRHPVDAIVVSNMSFVHAEQRFAALSPRTPAPVYCWFRVRVTDRSVRSPGRSQSHQAS